MIATFSRWAAMTQGVLGAPCVMAAQAGPPLLVA